MRTIKFHSYDHKYYQQNLHLRDAILRRPIGKKISPDDLETEMDNDFYGLIMDDKLLGTLSIYAEQSHVAHLTAFAVDSHFQKQGLGTRLLKFTIADLRHRGFTQIKVNARVSAKEFYTKNGFIVVGEKYHNQWLGIDDYVMIYQIK